MCYPLPDIYSSVLANQWVGISNYSSHVRGQSLAFRGPLEEYPRNRYTDTAPQAWGQLWYGLQGQGLNTEMSYSVELQPNTIPKAA